MSPTPTTQPHESGYLLLLTAVVVIVVAGLLATLSDTVRRNATYDYNFGLGAQFAESATAAHIAAQRTHYTTPPTSIDNVPLTLTGNDNSFPASFTLRVIGIDAAPFDTSVPPSDRAASALVIMRPQLAPGQVRTAVENQAFLDGAKSRGMPNAGVVSSAGFVPSDTCNGAATSVRWGASNAECLTVAQLASYGLQPGDIVAPAWEVALARADQYALMRYKQPNRPEMNRMATAVTFTPGRTIAAADNVTSVTAAVDTLQTNNVSATNSAALGDATAPALTINGTLNVPNNSVTHTSGPVQVNAAMNVARTESGTSLFGNCIAQPGQICPP